MLIVSVIGRSGSGKTTLLEHLIRHYASRGSHVAALKHTHHALTMTAGGDTDRFMRAGAREAILADDSEAVVWRTGCPPERVRFEDRDALIRRFDADWLFIEGYKSDPPGIAIVVGELDELPGNVAAILQPRRARNVPSFERDQWAELASFLDKISSS